MWSWDITWLKSLTAGHWFYLYLIEDMFGRKIVGYEVHRVKAASMRQGCWQRCRWCCMRIMGPPMKSHVLQVKLAELKITPSHSRLRVSKDNAHVESLFRTLKYVPSWPEKDFATLEEARPG